MKQSVCHLEHFKCGFMALIHCDLKDSEESKLTEYTSLLHKQDNDNPVFISAEEIDAK